MLSACGAQSQHIRVRSKVVRHQPGGYNQEGQVLTLLRFLVGRVGDDSGRAMSEVSSAEGSGRFRVRRVDEGGMLARHAQRP